MKTPLTPYPLLDPISRVLAAINHVHKAFGPPGNFGYSSKEGNALFELYEAHNALSHYQPINREVCDCLAACKAMLASMAGPDDCTIMANYVNPATAALAKEQELKP